MDRTSMVAALWEEVGAVLQEALAEQLETLCSGDLQTLEGHLQPLMRLVGGALLSGLARLRLAALAGRVPGCPTCGGAMRLVDQRQRVLQGLVGDLRLRRPYYHCGACRRGLAPLDEAWGLGSGTLTPALARVACRAGLEVPFVQAADLLWEHLGVHVEPEVVRAIGEAVGQVVEADQQDATQWAVAPEAVPAVLLVAVDGVLVHERSAWRECKVGRVAPLGPQLVRAADEDDVHLALGPSTYCAGLEEADRFWPRVMREVVRAGWSRGVRTVVLLGDGADWIWRQGRTQLRAAGVAVVEIVDFYHACEHLGTVAKAVFGSGSLRASDWLDRQAHLLRHQGVRPIRRALAALQAPSAAAADTLRKARGYFRTHAARMQYPAFHARRFPIGSGAVESTAKNLIQVRQVQAGMRWSEQGAQELASLRALHRSGRWNTFWGTQPQRRLRRLVPRLLPALPVPATITAEASATMPVDAGVAQVTGLPPAAATTCIQTKDKPWAKGTNHWRNAPSCRSRSA
jgi:hypothetical protein